MARHHSHRLSGTYPRGIQRSRSRRDDRCLLRCRRSEVSGLAGARRRSATGAIHKFVKVTLNGELLDRDPRHCSTAGLGSDEIEVMAAIAGGCPRHHSRCKSRTLVFGISSRRSACKRTEPAIQTHLEMRGIEHGRTRGRSPSLREHDGPDGVLSSPSPMSGSCSVAAASPPRSSRRNVIRPAIRSGPTTSS